MLVKERNSLDTHRVLRHAKLVAQDKAVFVEERNSLDAHRVLRHAKLVARVKSVFVKERNLRAPYC